MALTLYNTFTKGDQEFVPIEKGKVRMYTCGPTVYGRPHIGNYSSFLMADLLRRWLEQSGYKVTHVKNITDVGHLVADQDEGEDKIERQAREENADPLAVARKYTEQYLEDERALNMLEPAFRPKATETIPEMIEIIRVLVEREHAYETEDGVYFSVETFPQYGALSGNTVENLKAGARVEVKEHKKHPADFALWKKTVGENAHHLLRWPSPWGEGFPGWHIECSAMARAHLGPQIDIHTGGEDNIFPHHESEIAQSECSGPSPFARVWIHKRRIDMDEEKMSKSLGNILTLPDIVAKGFHPLDLRYLFLSVHYRTRLKFTWKGLDDARKARLKIVEWISEAEALPSDAAGYGADEAQVWQRRFAEAMNADLNTSAALGVVFECMTWSRKRGLSPEGRGEVKNFIHTLKLTFGCFLQSRESLPPAVEALLSEREAARARKDFTASDRLREEINAQGFEVKDTVKGQKVLRM